MDDYSGGDLRKASHIVFLALLVLLALSPGPYALLDMLRTVLPFTILDFRPTSALAALLANAVYSGVGILIPCAVIMLTLKIPVSAAFPVRAPKARMLIPAVFCCLGVSTVGVYISGFLRMLFSAGIGRVPVMPDTPPPYGLPETAAYFVSIALIPAVLEELLFRGAVLCSLRRFGGRFALIASAILFACIHRNLVQGPNAFLAGLVLGYFALRSGNVLIPVITHFLNNAVAAAVSVSMLYLPRDIYTLLNFCMMPLYLGLGVLGVVLMNVWNGGFILPEDTPGEYPEIQKHRCFFSTAPALAFLLLSGYFMVRNFA